MARLTVEWIIPNASCNSIWQSMTAKLQTPENQVNEIWQSAMGYKVTGVTNQLHLSCISCHQQRVISVAYNL